MKLTDLGSIPSTGRVGLALPKAQAMPCNEPTALRDKRNHMG
jgi:hypothetical protein